MMKMGAEMSIRLIMSDKIIFRMFAFSNAAYGLLLSRFVGRFFSSVGNLNFGDR